jgi:hypothetical protein
MLMEEKQETSMVPQIVKPLITVEEAVEAWRQFEDLKKRLLIEDDYQQISDKKYIKRSGFRKLGVFFGLSSTLINEERTDREDKTFMWRITVYATAPNKREMPGVGVCDSRERNFAHLEHDVYATAYTRALNRAISDMIAGGAVSAEELEASSPLENAKNITPPPPQPQKEMRELTPEDVEKALDNAQLDRKVVTIEVQPQFVLARLNMSQDQQTWNDFNNTLVQLDFRWVAGQKMWQAPRFFSA